jgi:hypothetical protein
MDVQDITTTQQSDTERQLRRMVVAAPAAYDPSSRIDVIHDPDPDIDLLWKGPD